VGQGYQSRGETIMSRAYYQSGSDVVVVETGAPGHGAMRIGIGGTWHEAVQDLESTPVAGHLESSEGLAWARGEGWIEGKCEPIEAPTCECECDCAEEATQLDEGGRPVSDGCATATYDADGDFVGCEASGLGETCRHCGERIKWGSIQTSPSGSGDANYRTGRCACGHWREEERGEWGHYSYSAYPVVHERDLPHQWHCPPECQGQIVVEEYGASGDGYGYCRTTDRGDRSVAYQRCDLSECGCEDECDCWDPANEDPSARYEWERVVVR
jgi:hypothetical protein